MKKIFTIFLIVLVTISNVFGFDHIKNLHQFEKSVQKGSYIIEFYATWCGHCEEMKDNLVKIDPKIKKKIKIYQVDIDKSPKVVAKYGTPQVPALLYIKDGKILDGYIGVKGMSELKRDMKRYFHISNI